MSDIEIIDDYGTKHTNLVKGRESWRQNDVDLSPGFAVGIRYKAIPRFGLIQKHADVIKIRPLAIQNDKLVVDNKPAIIIGSDSKYYNELNENINRVFKKVWNTDGTIQLKILK